MTLRLALLPALVVVALLAVAPGAAAQVDSLALLRQLVEANSRQDLEAIFALLTDDHVQVGGGCADAPGGFCAGKDAIRRHAAATADEAGAATYALVGTPVVSVTLVTARIEVRPDPVPEPLATAGVERVLATIVVVTRGERVAFSRFDLDADDPQTASAARLIEADAAEAGQAPLGEPAVVVGATVAALNLGNVEAVTALLSETVVHRSWPLPGGHVEIQAGRQAVLAGVRRAIAARTRVEVADLRVTGDRARYTTRWTSDELRARGIDALTAASEASLEGGMIASITDSLTPESVAKLRATQSGLGGPGAPPAPAQIPGPR